MPREGDVMDAVAVLCDGKVIVTATDWTDEERERRGHELTTFVFRGGEWVEVETMGEEPSES